MLDLERARSLLACLNGTTESSFMRKQEGNLLLPAVRVCEYYSCKLQKTKLAINGPPFSEETRCSFQNEDRFFVLRIR